MWTRNVSISCAIVRGGAEGPETLCSVVASLVAPRSDGSQGCPLCTRGGTPLSPVTAHSLAQKRAKNIFAHSISLRKRAVRITCGTPTIPTCLLCLASRLTLLPPTTGTIYNQPIECVHHRIRNLHYYQDGRPCQTATSKEYIRQALHS